MDLKSFAASSSACNSGKFEPEAGEDTQAHTLYLEVAESPQSYSGALGGPDDKTLDASAGPYWGFSFDSDVDTLVDLTNSGHYRSREPTIVNLNRSSRLTPSVSTTCVNTMHWLPV